MRVGIKSNILFLPKIKKEDFISIDDVFENRLLTNANNIDTPYVQIEDSYDKIPTRFYNIAKWISSTNIRCWNCARKFHSVPMFIPSRILYDEEGFEYMDVIGNFCTINCAYTYSLKSYKESDAVDCHARLLLLYEMIYKQRILKIPQSPHKEEMLEFGGELTSEEYEKEIAKRNNEQNLTKYKLEHFRFDAYS